MIKLNNGWEEGSRGIPVGAGEGISSDGDRDTLIGAGSGG